MHIAAYHHGANRVPNHRRVIQCARPTVPATPAPRSRGVIPRLAQHLAVAKFKEGGEQPVRTVRVLHRPGAPPVLAGADDALKVNDGVMTQRSSEPMTRFDAGRATTRPVVDDRLVVGVPTHPLAGLGPLGRSNRGGEARPARRSQARCRRRRTDAQAVRFDGGAMGASPVSGCEATMTADPGQSHSWPGEVEARRVGRIAAAEPRFPRQSVSIASSLRVSVIDSRPIGRLVKLSGPWRTVPWRSSESPGPGHTSLSRSDRRVRPPAHR